MIAEDEDIKNHSFTLDQVINLSSLDYYTVSALSSAATKLTNFST